MAKSYMASTDSLAIDLEREYDLGNETHVLLNKPTMGFWASGIEGGTTTWREQAPESAPKGGIAFSLGDGAKVLELDRREDFAKVEGYIREYEIREGMAVKSVDWEAVGRDWDAVHVSESYVRDCSVAAWDDMSRDFSAWGEGDSLWVTESGLSHLKDMKRVEDSEDILEYERVHEDMQALEEEAEREADEREAEERESRYAEPDGEYVEQTWLEDRENAIADSRESDWQLWMGAADGLVSDREAKAAEAAEAGRETPPMEKEVDAYLSDPKWVRKTMDEFRAREGRMGSRAEFARAGYHIEGNVMKDAEAKAQYELCRRYDAAWRETHDDRLTQGAYERNAVVQRIVEAERWGRAWTFYTKSFGTEMLDKAPDRPFFCRALDEQREAPGTAGYVACIKENARAIELFGEERGQGVSFRYTQGSRTLDLDADQDLREYMNRKGEVRWDRVARDYDVIKAPADRDVTGLWGKNEFLMPRGQTLICNSRCIEDWTRTEDVAQVAKLVEKVRGERAERMAAGTRAAAEEREGVVASEYVKADGKLYLVDTREIEGIGYHTMTVPTKMSENGKPVPDWNGKPKMKYHASREKAEAGHAEAVSALKSRTEAAQGKEQGKERAKADAGRSRAERASGGESRQRGTVIEETTETTVETRTYTR